MRSSTPHRLGLAVGLVGSFLPLILCGTGPEDIPRLVRRERYCTAYELYSKVDASKLPDGKKEEYQGWTALIRKVAGNPAAKTVEIERFQEAYEDKDATRAVEKAECISKLFRDNRYMAQAHSLRNAVNKEMRAAEKQQAASDAKQKREELAALRSPTAFVKYCYPSSSHHSLTSVEKSQNHDYTVECLPRFAGKEVRNWRYRIDDIYSDRVDLDDPNIGRNSEIHRWGFDFASPSVSENDFVDKQDYSKLRRGRKGQWITIIKANLRSSRQTPLTEIEGVSL